jgi:diaminopimelate decarboxylase
MNEVLSGGRLGGHDPSDLAERFGTPFYAYDLDVVTSQVEALRSILPLGFDLAYAVKANPNLAVLRHLQGLGPGADVASCGELRHVLRAGFPADIVVFTGPGKRDEELAAAVAAGVRVVTVESPGELRRLARIAEGLGRRQPILLRAAVTDPADPGRAGSTGVDITGKFGMDPSDMRAAAAEAVASPWVEPLGLHAFGWSSVTDAAILALHIEATVDAAARLAASAGFELRLVDAGGGLGISYGAGDPTLDLFALGTRLTALADRLGASEATRSTRVLLEPGRFLVGAAGVYVARVVDRKTMDGNLVVILDGGIHHLLRPVLVGREQRIAVLTGSAARNAPEPGNAPGYAGGSASVMIAGPLCTGLDVFARAACIAPPESGDLVAVLDVGAYGATESMPFFLSHPLPPEIALRGGEAWLARPRVDPDTWLGWQT